MSKLVKLCLETHENIRCCSKIKSARAEMSKAKLSVENVMETRIENNFSVCNRRMFLNH